MVIASKSFRAPTGRAKLVASDPERNARAEQFGRNTEPLVPRMTRLAERLAGPADRDDIVQEALVRAWLKWDQFDPQRGTLSSWLMAITADRARKHRRKWRIALFTAPQRPPSPGEYLEVEEAVAKLPVRQRLAVDSYYFVGLTVPETAAVMRCSVGTVKATLAAARRNLRKALEGQE